MARREKQPEVPDRPISVLIEFRQLPGSSGAFMASVASQLDVPGCAIDHRFEPVPMGGGLTLATGAGTFIIRAEVSDMSVVEALRARPDVVGVWIDTPVAPFARAAKGAASRVGRARTAAARRGSSTARSDARASRTAGGCGVEPCDCDPAEPKGNLADVANYLGATDLWVRGYYGEGVVVGIVDGGITAQGRQVKSGETQRRIGRVIGGWPEVDWGTEAARWDEHGNMCATDVLGIAPRAQLYDLRIGGVGGTDGTLSRALQAFQWAINRHRVDGTPQVLSNSWGVYQEAWDLNYASNPNHPFTRKVGEAVEEGIVVLFAAGNCGAGCPSASCGGDAGPGRSIWGANGHPSVITVAAVNRDEEYVGYSSQGPAALDPNKPDVCGVTHFDGYHRSDTGTSAACPTVAGVVALLLQGAPAASPAQVKLSLMVTARDVGPPGWDPHTGAGIVKAVPAFEHCVGSVWASEGVAAGAARGGAGYSARRLADAASGSALEELTAALETLRRDLARQQRRLEELDFRYQTIGAPAGRETR